MPYAPLTKKDAQAWVNFQANGTINDKFNVESVVKNSTGRFTVTFEYPMASNEYTVSITPADSSGNLVVGKAISQTQENFVVQLYGGNVVILGITVMTAAPIDPNTGVLITVNGG